MFTVANWQLYTVIGDYSFNSKLISNTAGTKNASLISTHIKSRSHGYSISDETVKINLIRNDLMASVLVIFIFL